MYEQVAFICTDGGCNDIVFLYFFVAPLAIIVALSTIVFFALRKKHHFGKVFGITLGSAILLVLSLVVIPTVIEDRSSRQKAERCAEEVGYETSADNNSRRATAESQAAFRECLNR